MILAKAKEESKNFYDVLDYYLEMIRHLHIKTYEFLSEKKASTNPLAYCQGGFYGGHLDPDEKNWKNFKAHDNEFWDYGFERTSILI